MAASASGHHETVAAMMPMNSAVTAMKRPRPLVKGNAFILRIGY